MISARRIITVLGTLICAAGTGFFMQHYMQSPDKAAQARAVDLVDAAKVVAAALADVAASGLPIL